MPGIPKWHSNTRSDRRVLRGLYRWHIDHRLPALATTDRPRQAPKWCNYRPSFLPSVCLQPVTNYRITVPAITTVSIYMYVFLLYVSKDMATRCPVALWWWWWRCCSCFCMVNHWTLYYSPFFVISVHHHPISILSPTLVPFLHYIFLLLRGFVTRTLSFSG